MEGFNGKLLVLTEKMLTLDKMKVNYIHGATAHERSFAFIPKSLMQKIHSQIMKRIAVHLII